MRPFGFHIVIIAFVALIGSPLGAAPKNSHSDSSTDRDFFENLSPTAGSIDFGSGPGDGFVYACQATPIENVEIPGSPNLCRLSLFTAAHCVATLKNSLSDEKYIILPRPSGTLKVLADEFDIHVRSNSVSGRGLALTQQEDSALVTITSECEKLKFIQAVPTAETLTSNEVSIQKRLTAIDRSANSGGGFHLDGKFLMTEGSDLRFRLDVKNHQAIVGADSGGGIFDKDGNLICAISGSSVPNGPGDKSTFDVTCDGEGIRWAKQILTRLSGGTPQQSLASSSLPPAPLFPAMGGSSGVQSFTPRALPFSGGALSAAPNQNQSLPSDLSANHGSSKVRYLVNGQWMPFIPLDQGHSNVVAINGQRIPSDAIGYKLGDQQNVIWVRNGSNGLGPIASAPSHGSFNSGQFEPAPLPPPPAPLPPGIGSKPATNRAPATTSPSVRSEQPVAATPETLTDTDKQAIARYEGKKYVDGHPREHFLDNMFQDIPRNGTGKVILAYFGPRRPDLEQMAQNSLVTVKNYPVGSPEHDYATQRGFGALGIDGLGRKLTRYQMDPKQALQGLLNGEEVRDLAQYNQAKGKPKTTSPHPTSAQPRSTASDLQSAGASNDTRVSPLQTPGFHSAIGKCLNCHSNNPGVPAALKNREGLVSHLGDMNDPMLNEMMGRANLTSEETHAIQNFVKTKRASRYQTTRSFAGKNVAPACYATAEDQARRTDALPTISGQSSALSSLLSAAKDAGQLMFYDKSTVPRAWNGALERSILSPEHQTNPDAFGKLGYHGNAGLEYPWVNPAGMDLAQNGSSEKFIIRPPNGELMRTGSRTRQNSPDHFGGLNSFNGPNLGWEYNAGTTFGEILKVNGLPFEIRLRSKQPNGSWTMDVLRPFESAEDLANGIDAICSGNAKPAGCQSLGNSLQSIRNQSTVRLVRQEDVINQENFGTARDPRSLSSTALNATAAVASLQDLPELPADVVRALLTQTPFKSVFGKPWTKGPPPGWAPTTHSHSSIVPKGYFGGLIPMTQESCMKCHTSAGRHVNIFNPSHDQKLPTLAGENRPRSWYDFVQGDDGILSFHPFSAQAVRNKQQSNSRAINPCLIQNGLIQ